jgi:hypothetical protein
MDLSIIRSPLLYLRLYTEPLFADGGGGGGGGGGGIRELRFSRLRLLDRYAGRGGWVATH